MEKKGNAVYLEENNRVLHHTELTWQKTPAGGPSFPQYVSLEIELSLLVSKKQKVLW